MSGGRFNYADERAMNEIFGYFVSDEEPLQNIFEDKEITELVYDVFNLIHDYDWYASGDTSKEKYIKSKQKFKKKWFKDKNEERAKRIIDESIGNLRKEMYETFCMELNDNESEK